MRRSHVLVGITKYSSKAVNDAMSVVSVPGMLRQEDHKVKASLRYIVRPKTSQTKPNNQLKKKGKKKNQFTQ